jgi:hypothetical protein
MGPQTVAAINDLKDKLGQLENKLDEALRLIKEAEAKETLTLSEALMRQREALLSLSKRVDELYLDKEKRQKLAEKRLKSE